MPSYRGVSQADVVSSITDALALLELHTTGPECQKLIDKLRTADPATGVSPLGAIMNAGSDADLATAIRGSGAGWLFMCTAEVLQFHAVYNTDGKGYDVVERLHKWDAGGGARVAAYYPIDAECDSWIAMSYARKVAPTEENLQKIAGVASAFTQDAAALGHAFHGITKMIEMGATGGTEDAIRKVYLDLDLHERHVARHTLSALSMDGAEADLAFDQPMARYCLVVDGLTDGSINHTDSSVQDIRTRVEEALRPFWESDEVGMTGIGLIKRGHKKGDPIGIVFESTQRAAQAVADALPGMKVLDQDCNKIAPNTLPPAKQKKPGFSL
jgi:hypothetical protein